VQTGPCAPQLFLDVAAATALGAVRSRVRSAGRTVKGMIILIVINSAEEGRLVFRHQTEELAGGFAAVDGSLPRCASTAPG